MSIEDNKRLVEKFTSYFKHSDVDAMLTLIADNASWWINGKPDLFPITGTITKAEFADINRGMAASLENGMRMVVVDMVGEDNQVAAELHAHAVTKAGRVYDNDYHMLFVFQDGRIAAVREYTDLMAVADVFPLPAIASDPMAPGVPQENSSAQSKQASSSSMDLKSFGDAKRLVMEYFGHFGRRNIDGLLAMMTADSTWWVNGNQSLFPGAGTKTKEQFAETLHQIFAVLDGGLRMDVDTIIAEGDRIVVQVHSHAVTKQGKLYENGFLIRLTLRDGMIAGVREYTDLLHASAVLG